MNAILDAFARMDAGEAVAWMLVENLLLFALALAPRAAPAMGLSGEAGRPRPVTGRVPRGRPGAVLCRLQHGRDRGRMVALADRAYRRSGATRGCGPGSTWSCSC